MAAKETGEQVTWDKFLEVAVEIFNLEKSSFVHLINKYIETFPSGERVGRVDGAKGRDKETDQPSNMVSVHGI